MDIDVANFNPRFPRGKRQYRGGNRNVDNLFQSTLPAGEATVEVASVLRALMISIHASRGGSDDFRVKLLTVHHIISIHASRGGSDLLPALKMPAT